MRMEKADRDIEVEDTANILVEYKNGAMGMIQSTTVATPGRPRQITVCGTKGSVVVREDVIESWDIDGEEVNGNQESEFNSGVDPMAFTEYYHKMQFLDLIEAIENDRKPLVDENEGRKPVDIILAAYESSNTEKRVEIE